MKTSKTALLSIALLFVLTSCSKDEDMFVEEQQSVIDTSQFTIEDKFSVEILDEVNLHRAAIGKSELKNCADSKIKAKEHSIYMASNKEMSHDNFFERSDFLKTKGAKHVSENVAFGYKTAKGVVQAWLKSPGHREALEGDFCQSGIVVVKTDRGVPYITQIFTRNK